MTSTASCLDEDTVMAFIEGRLSEDALEVVDSHIDLCPKCRAVLLEAAGNASTAGGEVSPLEVSPGRTRSLFSRATLSPGTVLAGRYRVVRFIGAGGMGEVYEAEDQVLRESIALKTVQAFIADHPRAVARLKREVQLARRVTHPNVCRIFDFSFHDELAFLTMELLEGETLGAKLRREGRMQPEQILPLVRQLADALDAAHRAGVIHRDFKSDNVMLVREADNTLRAVVMDFGLARAQFAEQLSSHGQTSGKPMVGTISHMAPEQIEGLQITPRTDIYALGIVLYEMVTAELPFIASSPISSAIKRLTGPPPSPRNVVRDLPSHWEAAILKCLERAPEERFPTATAVAESLSLATAVPRRRWSRIAVPALVVAAGLSLVAFAKPAARKLSALGVSSVAAKASAEHPPVAAELPPKPAPVPAEAQPRSAPVPQAADAKLLIRVDAPSAQVNVDGRPVTLRDGTAEVRLDQPGRHMVLVKAAGRKSFERAVEVAAGATVHLEVPLEPAGATKPTQQARLPAKASTGKPASVGQNPRPPSAAGSEDDGVIDPYRSTR